MTDRIPFEATTETPAFWTRVGDTFRLAFTNPGEFFTRIPNGDRITAPWRLMLLFSTPLYALLLLYVLIFGLFGAAAALSSVKADRWVGIILAVGFAAFAVLAPVFQLVCMLLVGLCHHAALALWGGLAPGTGLRATLRATGYVQAFLVLAAFLPVINLLSPIAGVVLLGWGLAKVHRTDTWRSVAAALTVFFTAGLLLIGLVVVAIVALVRLDAAKRPAAPPPISEPAPESPTTPEA